MGSGSGSKVKERRGNSGLFGFGRRKDSKGPVASSIANDGSYFDGEEGQEDRRRVGTSVVATDAVVGETTTTTTTPTRRNSVFAGITRKISLSSTQQKANLRPPRSQEEMLVKVQEVADFFVKRKTPGASEVETLFFPNVLLRTIVKGKRGTMVSFIRGIGFYSWSDDCVSFFHPWLRIKGWGKIEDDSPEARDCVAGYLYVPLPGQEQTIAMEFGDGPAERTRFLDMCHTIANAISTPEERVANDHFANHPADDAYQESW